jgi:hypothetical protein
LDAQEVLLREGRMLVVMRDMGDKPGVRRLHKLQATPGSVKMAAAANSRANGPNLGL